MSSYDMKIILKSGICKKMFIHISVFKKYIFTFYKIKLKKQTDKNIKTKQKQ